MKHFKEDEEFKELQQDTYHQQLQYNSLNYYKVLEIRDKVHNMTPVELLRKKEHIWDFQYVSSSGDEDNDSALDSESYDEEEDGEDEIEEDKKDSGLLFRKNVKG